MDPRVRGSARGIPSSHREDIACIGDEMDRKLDELSRRMGQATSRRQALKILGAGLLGSGLLAHSAYGAPRTCATCTCGVGRPCNPKQQFCVEVGRGFPTAEDQCSALCEQQGFKFCGAGNQFHCPQGCPS
jgi:hypothetical protein